MPQISICRSPETAPPEPLETRALVVRRIFDEGQGFVVHTLVFRFLLLGLSVAVCIPGLAQSVISTHSGLVYFFEGSVSIGEQPLPHRFGRFQDLGEGRELTTGRGRAEVLLTPDVVLRIGENSAIR